MSEIKPTHYHVQDNKFLWPRFAGTKCVKCDQEEPSSDVHGNCPRCRPDLWREIVAADAAPEPKSVWWCRDLIERNQWNNTENDEKEFPYACALNTVSETKQQCGCLKCQPSEWHYGPTPPCEDGKHEWDIIAATTRGSKRLQKCRICHASLVVGASESVSHKTQVAPVNTVAETVRKAAPSPKPLHQDPMRFRGHLEGCHAWRWENYERCSCYVHFTPMLSYRPEAVNPMPLEFTPRLTDWDL